MTDTSHATPGPLPPPQQRSHGCLWGCLIAALIAVAAIVGGFSYLGWYSLSGFKNDETLQYAMHAVNDDQTARAVLGDNIVLGNVESFNFSSTVETGKTASYVAHIKGSKGEGTLRVTVTTHDGNRQITAMTLTGPDGRTYDLVSLQQSPPGAI